MTIRFIVIILFVSFLCCLLFFEILINILWCIQTCFVVVSPPRVRLANFEAKHHRLLGGLLYSSLDWCLWVKGTSTRNHRCVIQNSLGFPVNVPLKPKLGGCGTRGSQIDRDHSRTSLPHRLVGAVGAAGGRRAWLMGCCKLPKTWDFSMIYPRLGFWNKHDEDLVHERPKFSILPSVRWVLGVISGSKDSSPNYPWVCLRMVDTTKFDCWKHRFAHQVQVMAVNPDLTWGSWIAGLWNIAIFQARHLFISKTCS